MLVSSKPLSILVSSPKTPDTPEGVTFVLIYAFRAAFVVEDHFRVIDAKQVHDGGVEVVDVELVLHRTLDFQSFLTVPWE